MHILKTCFNSYPACIKENPGHFSLSKLRNYPQAKEFFRCARYILAILFVSSTYVYAQTNEQRTMTILAVKDTSTGSLNRGLLEIKGEKDAGSTKYSSKVYIQFALNTIPVGAIVTSWTLRVY